MAKNNKVKGKKNQMANKKTNKAGKGSFIGKKLPDKNVSNAPILKNKKNKKNQKPVEDIPESSDEEASDIPDVDEEDSDIEAEIQPVGKKVQSKLEAGASTSDDDDDDDDDDLDEETKAQEEGSDKENLEEDSVDEDDEENEQDGDADDSDEEVVTPQPKKVKVTKPVLKTSAATSNTEEAQPSLRCFVSGLSKETTDNSLRQLFVSKNLSVTDCFIPGGSFGPKGYAFVEFETAQMATTAISMSGHSLDGNEISITYAKPKRGPAGAPSYSDSKETNILIVKNLAPSTTREMLESSFKGAQDIRLLSHPDGTCKGQAFIEYSTSEAAKEVKDSDPPSVGGARVMLDFAAPRGANRFNRGGFSRGNGSFRDRDGDDFGGRRGGGSFRGGNRGVGKFGGGRGFGGGDRGGFRGRSGYGGDRRGGFGGDRRGSFGGSRGAPRGNRIQFDDD